MDAANVLKLTTSADRGVPASPESSLPAAPGRGPRLGRILVMDGNGMVRETIRRQLLVLGYEVAVTGQGGEAVAACEQARGDGKPFDVVILGALRDDGRGDEQTLAEIRNLQPGVKTMIWSDWLEPRLRAHLRPGDCCVLGKPHSLEELRLKLDELLPLQGRVARFP